MSDVYVKINTPKQDSGIHCSEHICSVYTTPSAAPVHHNPCFSAHVLYHLQSHFILFVLRCLSFHAKTKPIVVFCTKLLVLHNTSETCQLLPARTLKYCSSSLNSFSFGERVVTYYKGVHFLFQKTRFGWSYYFCSEGWGGNS